MSSGIIYAAVAQQDKILVSNQILEGDYESVTKTFLPSLSIASNTKTCYQSGILNYHILVDNMLVYVCVADTEFGRSVPYAFLNEVKQRFTSGSLGIRAFEAAEHEFDRDFGHILKEQMNKFGNDCEIDSVGKVKKQVKEVMGVMTENIEKVCERGEKLETLIDKTNELEVTSSQFKSTSKKVRRRMWMKNMKMWFIIGALVLIIITIITLLATHVIPT